MHAWLSWKETGICLPGGYICSWCQNLDVLSLFGIVWVSVMRRSLWWRFSGSWECCVLWEPSTEPRAWRWVTGGSDQFRILSCALRKAHMRSTQSLASLPSVCFEMVVVNAVHWVLGTVKFSSRWYLSAQESPYVLYPISWKFPQCCLWDGHYDVESEVKALLVIDDFGLPWYDLRSLRDHVIQWCSIALNIYWFIWPFFKKNFF